MRIYAKLLPMGYCDKNSDKIMVMMTMMLMSINVSPGERKLRPVSAVLPTDL